MPGWIIPRQLKDGSTVFDIGYRVGGKAVRKKGGRTRAEAETALILALGDVATGRIRAHTTDRLGVYAERWLERRAAFVEPGTIPAYRNDVAYRVAVGILRISSIGLLISDLSEHSTANSSFERLHAVYG